MVTGTVVVVVEIGAGETAGSAAGSIAVGVSGVTVIVTGTVIGMFFRGGSACGCDGQPAASSSYLNHPTTVSVTITVCPTTAEPAVLPLKPELPDSPSHHHSLSIYTAEPAVSQAGH